MLGGSMRRRRGKGEGPRKSPLVTAQDWLAWRQKEARTRLALIGVGVAILGFGFGWLLATRAIFPPPEPPGDMYVVPDLYGVEVAEAVRLIEEAGLTRGLVDPFRHPEADSGLVVGQDPLPGQLARPGDSVRVSVSMGVERRSIPDVSHLRSDRARVVLESAGFTVAFDSVEADVPRGSILEIEPAPGTEVAVFGEVRLSVSTGPPEVTLPSLIGMAEETARDTLAVLGLRVNQTDEISSNVPDPPIVLFQDPPPGRVVLRGTVVRINVLRRVPRPDTLPGDRPRR
jgi:beta-lactam-binding protein with PASTA domain